jgi:hypothetical protein
MTATHEPRRGEPIGAEISEDVVRFGNADQLVGIVSRPDRVNTSTQAPTIVILNAGVIHRVGPHRLHVVLARRLAELGFSALRLDLGGIGDSIASSDATTFRDSAVADTRLAFDGFGARRYVIFGVCAGADNALATALVDDRVGAIVLVDPYVYANKRGQLRAAIAKVRALGPREAIVRGARAARRIVGERLAQRYARDPDEPDQAGGREAPPIATYRADLSKLVARGVRVLAIYSGVHGAKYNAADQLFELFPELRGKVDRAYFPHANHTFTELDVQRELVDTTATWIAQLPT